MKILKGTAPGGDGPPVRDRGRDSKISEAFILNELEKANTSRITHFQLDDGWQEG